MIKTPTWSTRGRYGRKRHYTTILLKFLIVGFLIIISSVMASTLSSIKTTTSSSSSSKRTASSNQKRSRTHAKISPQQSCTGHAMVPSNRRACGLFLWDLVGKRMNVYILWMFHLVTCVCYSKQTTKQNKVILSLFSIFNDGTKIQIQRQITALRGPV